MKSKITVARPPACSETKLPSVQDLLDIEQINHRPKSVAEGAAVVHRLARLTYLAALGLDTHSHMNCREHDDAEMITDLLDVLDTVTWSLWKTATTGAAAQAVA